MKQTKNKLYNFLLCLKYPFLKPRNIYDGKIVEQFDYSYTEFSTIPSGWNKAFVKDLLKELKKQIKKDHLSKSFRIVDVKEKFGKLRISADGCSDGVYKILNKYEDLSKEYCIYCGKPSKHLTNYFEFVCDKCFDKLEGGN